MQIKSIDALSLKKRLDEGSIVLIDIRESHSMRVSASKARGSHRYRSCGRRTSAPMTKSPFSIVTAAGAPAQMRAFSCRKASATPVTRVAASWRGRRRVCRRDASNAAKAPASASAGCSKETELAGAHTPPFWPGLRRNENDNGSIIHHPLSELSCAQSRPCRPARPRRKMRPVPSAAVPGNADRSRRGAFRPPRRRRRFTTARRFLGCVVRPVPRHGSGICISREGI